MRPIWPPPGGLDLWGVAYDVVARDPDGAKHSYVWAYDPRRTATGERGLRRRVNGVWIPID